MTAIRIYKVKMFFKLLKYFCFNILPLMLFCFCTKPIVWLREILIMICAVVFSFYFSL